MEEIKARMSAIKEPRHQSYVKYPLADIRIIICAVLCGLDIMNGKEILTALRDEQAYKLVTKAQNHACKQSLSSWAKAELEEAKKMGITDGSNPMQLIPRYQAVILAKRTAESG